MFLLSARSARSAIAVIALLPISSVYARPIQDSGTATQIQPATNIQPRDPVRLQTESDHRDSNREQRLIPDTEHYLADLFSMLGVENPSTSETPTPTVTPSIHITAEQDKPVNIKATGTPTTSATKSSTTLPTMYTTNIRHGDTRPIENIQIGSGWTGGKKLQASDLPVIFAAVSKELDHSFRNMIDSSDERGLGDDTESNERFLKTDSNPNDFSSELGFLE